MSYMESVLLGIAFGAIPGPIFFEVLRRALTRGYWHGALLSIGEFGANLLMLVLGFLGAYNFLEIKEIKSGFFLVGAGVLIFLGIQAIIIKKKDIENKDKAGQKSKGNSIVTGFLLAISSPIAMAVNISVGAAFASQYSSTVIALTNIFLVAFGVIIFFFALAGAVSLTMKKLPDKYILGLSKIFGIVLIGYGINFLYQLFLLLI